MKNWLLLLSLGVLIFTVSCGDDEPTEPPLDPRFEVSASSLSFGEIESGASSTRSFTFSGRDLTDDISITASGDGFSVSLSETDGFGASVTVAAADVNEGDVTVYAMFTSTTEGESSGSVTVTSELGSNTITLSGSVAAVIVPKDTQWIEDFDYSGSLMESQANRHADIETALAAPETWVNVREEGNDMSLVDGLTFTDYPSSGIGKALSMNGNGNTVNYARTLADLATDTLETLFVSFMVNVAAVPSANNGEQPIIIGTWNTRDGAPGADFQQRFVVKDDGAGSVQFGIVSNAGLGNATFADKAITLGQTYLVVMKYVAKGTDVGGTIPDGADVLSMYILDAVTETEPSTADQVYEANSKRDMEIIILQARAGDIVLDGIRVANTWADLF